jgi:hypothetical protein
MTWRDVGFLVAICIFLMLIYASTGHRVVDLSR